MLPAAASRRLLELSSGVKGRAALAAGKLYMQGASGVSRDIDRAMKQLLIAGEDEAYRIQARTLILELRERR